MEWNRSKLESILSVFQSIRCDVNNSKTYYYYCYYYWLMVVVAVVYIWDRETETHSSAQNSEKKLGVISCAQLSCQIAVLVSNINEWWWCLVQMSMLFNSTYMNWTHLIDRWMEMVCRWPLNSTKGKLDRVRRRSSSRSSSCYCLPNNTI